MDGKLTTAQRRRVAEELLGSSSDAYSFAKYLKLDPFRGPLEIEAAANEFGVWLCDSCGWWIDEADIHEFQPGVICKECKE